MDSRSVAENVGACAGACWPLLTASSYRRLASLAIELEMSLADTVAPCKTLDSAKHGVSMQRPLLLLQTATHPHTPDVSLADTMAPCKALPISAEKQCVTMPQLATFCLQLLHAV